MDRADAGERALRLSDNHVEVSRLGVDVFERPPSQTTCRKTLTWRLGNVLLDLLDCGIQSFPRAAPIAGARSGAFAAMGYGELQHACDVRI